MSIRIGDFAVTFIWSTANYGFAVRKWRYKHLASWRHGTAYLGRLKIVW